MHNLQSAFSLGTDDDHCVVLKSISDGVNCEHDYINATYIDVRPGKKTKTKQKQHKLDFYLCVNSLVKVNRF